ncbi:MAG: SH3 domain-containing protein [Lachnospiraceae bacterium]|nr:SH3 domain-containing protein [Lachnospiraceae bacterium]
MDEKKDGFFARMKNAEKKGFEITMFVISIAIAFVVVASTILLIAFWNSSDEDKVTDEEVDVVTITESAVEATAEPTKTPYGNAIINDDLNGIDEDMIDEDLASHKFGYTTAIVNMRSEASLTASVVTKVPANTRVKFIKLHDEEWMEVTYNGMNGFINAMYLSASKPEAIVTVTPKPAATAAPTKTPKPTKKPTPKPTKKPKTPKPTKKPTPEPTKDPTPEPTKEPTPEPTKDPVETPKASDEPQAQ